MEGMIRFSVGLGKKTILADHCGVLAESFLPLGSVASVPVSGVWLGSLCYMLQIYLDFFGVFGHGAGAWTNDWLSLPGKL